MKMISKFFCSFVSGEDIETFLIIQLYLQIIDNLISFNSFKIEFLKLILIYNII